MKNYKLGNWLRGGFSRHFKSKEEAWKVLGSRYLLSFPCETIIDGEWKENPKGGRMVNLYVEEENQYGITQWLVCKSDYFNMNERVDIDSYKFHTHSPTDFYS
tara:strand:- start:43364 stop:43672 length:309 start_codon:yes stop_codon:yes gene_type:complete